MLEAAVVPMTHLLVGFYQLTLQLVLHPRATPADVHVALPRLLARKLNLDRDRLVLDSVADLQVELQWVEFEPQLLGLKVHVPLRQRDPDDQMELLSLVTLDPLHPLLLSCRDHSWEDKIVGRGLLPAGLAFPKVVPPWLFLLGDFNDQGDFLVFKLSLHL